MVARGSSVVSFRGKPAPVAAVALDGEFPAIRFDMLHYRSVFPDRWTSLLRSHFRGAYHVEVFFGIDSKTARDWWHGKTGPSGAFVIRAIISIPGALEYLMAA